MGLMGFIGIMGQLGAYVNHPSNHVCCYMEVGEMARSITLNITFSAIEEKLYLTLPKHINRHERKV